MARRGSGSYRALQGAARGIEGAADPMRPWQDLMISIWSCSTCRHLRSKHPTQGPCTVTRCACSAWQRSIPDTCIYCNHTVALHSQRDDPGPCKAMGCSCWSWRSLGAGALRTAMTVEVRKKYGAGSESLTEATGTETQRHTTRQST